MFERRGNFDLRRLLSGMSHSYCTTLMLMEALFVGAEAFMHSLLSRLEFDIAMSTSSLNCLKLDPNLRKTVADALVPTSKIKVYRSLSRVVSLANQYIRMFCT